MTSHWRIYTPIEDVTTFDASGAGPVLRRLNITANTHRSRLYPSQAIALGVVGIGALSLTPEQLDTLIVQLQTAQRDLRATSRTPLTATGAEGCCEECSRAVLAGEPIVVEDEGTADRVVLHVGQCPDAAGRN